MIIIKMITTEWINKFNKLHFVRTRLVRVQRGWSTATPVYSADEAYEIKRHSTSTSLFIENKLYRIYLFLEYILCAFENLKCTMPTTSSSPMSYPHAIVDVIIVVGDVTG